MNTTQQENNISINDLIKGLNSAINILKEKKILLMGSTVFSKIKEELTYSSQTVESIQKQYFYGNEVVLIKDEHLNKINSVPSLNNFGQNSVAIVSVDFLKNL